MGPKIQSQSELIINYLTIPIKKREEKRTKFADQKREKPGVMNTHADKQQPS